MKSAAKILLEIFDISTNIRPAKIEPLLIGMLFTLNKHGLLQEAIQDITKYTDLPLNNPGKVAMVSALVKLPEFVQLYNDEKALRILIELLPTMYNTDGLSVVHIDKEVLFDIVNRGSLPNAKRELKRIVKKLNSMELGYTIFQAFDKAGIEDFYIMNSTDREDIIKTINKNNLTSPAVLDYIFKD